MFWSDQKCMHKMSTTEYCAILLNILVCHLSYIRGRWKGGVSSFPSFLPLSPLAKWLVLTFMCVVLSRVTGMLLCWLCELQTHTFLLYYIDKYSMMLIWFLKNRLLLAVVLQIFKWGVLRFAFHLVSDCIFEECREFPSHLWQQQQSAAGGTNSL